MSDLPDHIDSVTYPDVLVYVDGRQIYLACEAHRGEGWVSVLRTVGNDNFNPHAAVLLDAQSDLPPEALIHGTVTFRRR